MSREELYEAVWSEALATLAPKFGISDVGLKKRCKGLGVPTPPRGYWAKLQNGHKVKKAPLPDSYSIERKKKRLPKSPDDLKRYTPPDRDYTLASPLPIIKATERALTRSKPDPTYGIVEVWQEGTLRTKVAPSNIARAMWLWTGLLEETKKLGLTFVKGGGTSFTDGKQTLSIELKEKTGRYMADKPKQKDEEFPRMYLYERTGPYPEYVPTGFLQFRAEEVYGAPCSHQWSDATMTPLDSRLPEIAGCIVQLLDRKAQREIELREAEVRRKEEAQRAYEEQERRKKAQARVRKLKRQAAALHQADELRMLAKRVRATLGDDVTEQASNWLDWSARIATALDPVEQFADALRKGEDPTIPDYEDLYPQTERRW